MGMGWPGNHAVSAFARRRRAALRAPALPIPVSYTHLDVYKRQGVDGVIVPREHVQQVAGLSRCTVWAAEETPMVELNAKADEEAALQRLLAGERVVLARGWEVIPCLLYTSRCV